MRNRLAIILVAAALTGGLTACDAVREATSAADSATDKASVCLDAAKLAGFYPDLSNPEQAVKDAEKTAADLQALAEKTGDATLKDALADMSAKVGELGPNSIDPASVTQWAKEKVGAANALTQACL
ncbi:bacteriophage spanin2 family protein [Actinokineospora xionganensis]|uniref:Bacteriophage spanin2 family protein n=1 Tax=Actinokineospora xionganensis TaxID=2684470 RepID=A0ABR7LFV5_9PSEU|nr:bacteriophage spanin2 family protein [Actinokineospora xionganensis]MBC6451604.1 bacteriophage spanin2 family protein [Actinokineospora xionganensis]